MKKITTILCFISLICATKIQAQDYTFKWNGASPYFENGIANQVSYIDFGQALIWGNVEISLTGSYNAQNTTGKYTKIFNIGRNLDAPFYSNTSEVIAALGPVATQWKLGEFEVDAAGHLRLPIYHLVTTANLVIVDIRGVSTSPVNTSIIQITEPQVIANTQTRDYRFTMDPMAIGTNKVDPDTKLTVGGKMSAREIKVSVVAGADFVFEPDYKNMSMAELEAYLKQYKRLPEIPAAAEMQKSGLEIGAFQIKLLQKIEELTLQLIEINKKVEAQEKEIKQLKIKTN
ncbi:hypothetical protein VRU48_12290 [Pedobacter sp. KR3-3]|uniref:Uncharacterized protein n=1 Tax=Pedobacter albus TaxID=3113905 RepID=A0ABU7I940_9SPHI|nr:hypothetical protein [Pedobacter sp. KR3-3]MEE1945891.1 hypothetical protein [Pedobacter sp. KR3-3]